MNKNNSKNQLIDKSSSKEKNIVVWLDFDAGFAHQYFEYLLKDSKKA